MPADTLVWHANFKINTDEGGYMFGFHQVGADEALVRTRFDDVASRLKKLMPKSADIFYASFSKLTAERDGRYLHLAKGPGEYVEVVGPPEVSDYDFPDTCINIRLETATGKIATHKFCPVPDEIVTGGMVTASITPVIGMPAGAIGAPGSGADWFAEFTLLMEALTKYAVHIPSAWVPGGEDQSTVYANCFATRVGSKKGGRVFI